MAGTSNARRTLTVLVLWSLRTIASRT